MLCDTAVMPLTTPITATATAMAQTPVAAQPAPNPAAVSVAVVQDPTHPHHGFSLGQFIGLALLGLSAYNQQNQPGSGPIIFTDPKVISPYLQGVLSLFPNL